MKPQLRAEGIISDANVTKFLVQCDLEESFYRFPGGGVEFGETASEAIARELIEEFDLPIEVGALAVINESIIEYDDKQRHDCTILHWCLLSEDVEPFDIKWHNEHANIKLIWKTIEDLRGKELYPEGIFRILEDEKINEMHHITIRKKY